MVTCDKLEPIEYNYVLQRKAVARGALRDLPARLIDFGACSKAFNISGVTISFC